jgi:octaprenyl-diphosphate synthase
MPMHAQNETISTAFEDVNALIVEQLRSEVALVEDIGQYIVEAGGKRLRPRLALLTAAALGGIDPRHKKFAAIIEFLHTATLLHDDVVDVSSLRRGRPTANAAFGNASSVLVGDFIYSRAFQLLVSIGDLKVLQDIADVTNRIAEGEVLQLVRAGDANTTEQQYEEVIRAKTAVLFGAACYGAAVLSGASRALCEQLREFGLNLGIAFQIIDDVLDYEGDPSTMGKNLGDDLAEGKPTLPLIHALRHAKTEDAAIIKQAITAKDSSELDSIVRIIKECGSLDYAREKANRYREKADTALTLLNESQHKSELLGLSERAVARAA